MEMETVAQPQKSDILSASARELTMSDACESSSSYEEEEESEEMMDSLTTVLLSAGEFVVALH